MKWLVRLAQPAPYGRGEETLLDPKVRDALQVEARHVRLAGPRWERLRTEILESVAADMGLADAGLRLEPLKLLVYRAGGHFSMHADTERTPGMVASLALIVPDEYTDGALVIEHAGETLIAGAGGAPGWRWVAWYADCRHCLEPVNEGTRIALTFGIAIDPEKPLTHRAATGPRARADPALREEPAIRHHAGYQGGCARGSSNSGMKVWQLFLELWHLLLELTGSTPRQVEHRVPQS